MRSLISKEIGAIAGPAIISNITTPLLAMIDVAIVGHIGSAVYIAAIAIGASMFNMLYWLFGFLRMGSSGMTAIAFGAGEHRQASLVLYRALALGIIGGCMLIVLSVPLSDLLLRFMDADAETLPQASRYFLIAITGAPATLGTFALSGWFLGMQDSRTPMWMALFTNIVNIIASLTLVYGCGMKIEGVAIGSAIAQWCGFIFGLTKVFRHYRPERPTLRQVADTTQLRRFFAVNTDIFLRTLCLVAVTMWFTRAGSMQGTDILAANALLLQLFMFFSYFMDGFAYAGEALAGKYAGRRDTASLKTVIGSLLKIGWSLAIVFAIAYLLLGHGIVSVLTDNQDVIVTCDSYMLWAAAVPLAGTLAFVWDGILIGLTRTRLMLASMFSATVLFFAIYFACRSILGNHGLWLAFLIYLMVRGVTEHLLYKYGS